MPKEKTPKMAVTIIIHSHICYVSMTIVIHFIYVMFRLFVQHFSYSDKDHCIRSKFWKFYLIRTGFFGECVFRLFRLEWMPSLLVLPTKARILCLFRFIIEYIYSSLMDFSP